MIALLFILTSSLAFAQEETDWVIKAQFLNSCFEQTEKLGRVPKPNCESSARAVFGTETIKYKYNSAGLRDREVSDKPAPGTTRILLMGSLAEGFALTEEDLPSRQLEKQLRKNGHDVEVINAAISGFFTPRSAVRAADLVKRYSPHYLVYLLSGDLIVNDYLESARLRLDENGEAIAFESSAAPSEPPAMLSWLWPSPSTEQLLSSAYERIKTLRQLSAESETPAQAASAFFQPTLHALKRMEQLFKDRGRVIVLFTDRPAISQTQIPGLGSFGNTIAGWLVPDILVLAGAMKQKLVAEGIPTYLLASPAFRSPIDANIVFPLRPANFNRRGAIAFGRVGARALDPIFQGPGKTQKN